MLAIRLQRTGRTGHAQYRMIVQDARKSPTSGKIVTALGSYNPHSKALAIDKEKAEFYLKNGAQPSPRVARLLSDDGMKMPEWASVAPKKERAIRNLEKLRRNRPAGEPAPVAEPAAAAEEVVATEESVPAESTEAETPVAEATETVETPPEATSEVEETAEVATEPEVAAEPETEKEEAPKPKA